MGNYPDYSSRPYYPSGDDARTTYRPPSWEKDVERHPDRIPSFGKNDIMVVKNGADMIWMLEVRDDNGTTLGAITFRAAGDPSQLNGKLVFKGMATFTHDQIYYNHDEEITCRSTK